MDEKAFRQFPVSFQLAQRSMVLAIAIPMMMRWLLRAKGGFIQILIWGSVSLCALVGLVATYYVVIRYPYIGLVDAKDGDLFSKYIPSQSNWLLQSGKILAVLVLLILLVAPALDRVIDARDIVMMLYTVSVLLFVLFLSIRYDRFQHPTVATFLRCSLGVGILFFPAFLPALIIGSIRAKQLLYFAQRELELEDRNSKLS